MSIKDIKKTDVYPYEGIAHSALFDTDILVQFEDNASIEYGELCVTYFNSMPTELLNDLCEISIRYCNEFLNEVGEEPEQFEKSTDVLSHISVQALVIPETEGIEKPVIHLSCNCTWEEEHGLEWVIRDDKVEYVGAFVYNDPLTVKATDNDVGNYASPQQESESTYKAKYFDEAKSIWKSQVPQSGQSKTVDGELIRAIERLQHEAFNNGNGNWDNGFVRFCNYIWDTLNADTVFNKDELIQIRSDIIRLLNHQSPYLECDIYDRLTDYIIVWCQSHDGFTKREIDPKQYR